jgi:membrane protease YdiL (CAAX protease family)
VEQFENDPILDPRQVAIVLLITLLVSFAAAPLLSFFNSSLALLLGEVMMILPALIFILRQNRPVFETFRLNFVNTKLILATVFLFIPVFILTDVLDRLVQQYFPMPTELLDALTDLVQFNNLVDGSFLVLAAVLVAPLAEEMLFRGMVQRTLEKYREPAMAIVLTSVFFSIVHFNPWTAIQITLLGLVLGYMTWKSGSIIPSVILHGLNNLFSLLLMNADEAQLVWYSHDEHVKILWIVAAFALIFPAFQYFKSTTEKQT